MWPKQLFSGAFKETLRRWRHWRAVRRYVRGYQRYPETEEEMVWVEAASHWPLEDSPWEDDTSDDTEQQA